jgi:phosphoglycolate phosphatase-like HAD superfamily hydrolase
VHDLSQLFDGIISTAQPYPQKPDPAIVLAALEKHNMSPATTWLIGSRTIDIQAGASAGIRTCLFGKVEAAVAADIQIEKYSQLVSMLTSEEGKRLK